jgi:hypothetical protein
LRQHSGLDVLHRLAKAEVVTIEVAAPRDSNPWVRLAGVYRDHPLFDELLAEMEADRQELDADEEVLCDPT